MDTKESSSEGSHSSTIIRPAEERHDEGIPTTQTSRHRSTVVPTNTRPVARGGSRGSIEPPQNLTYDAHAQICNSRAARARALCYVCAGQGKNGWA